MIANVTLSQVYWNKSLTEFFMREQAIKTLEELCERAGDTQGVIDAIDFYADENDCDLDSIEEMLYSESVEWIAEYIGIEIDNR